MNNKKQPTNQSENTLTEIFKYEVKDNYITKVIIDEDGEKYEYEIFYEN